MWIQYRAEHCMMSFLGRWFADGIATLRTSNVTMESVPCVDDFPSFKPPFSSGIFHCHITGGYAGRQSRKINIFNKKNHG
jgi:hypothetical protein